jgi:hypothetical protein
MAKPEKSGFDLGDLRHQVRVLCRGMFGYGVGEKLGSDEGSVE